MAALSSLKVDAIPKKKNLITISDKDEIDKAFGKLFDNRILSAPVVDASGKVHGLLGMIDVAVFAVNLARTSQNLVEMLGLPVGHPELLSNFENVPDLLTGERRLEEAFGTTPTEFMKNFSRRNPTMSVVEGSPLLNAIRALGIVRRIVVLNDQGILVNYVTQTDVIKYISENNLLGDKADKSLSDLRLGLTPIITIRDNQRVMEAFKQFAIHNIEAVPVVDADGKIVGNISATDIRVMKASADAIDSLYLTFHQFHKLMSTFDSPKEPVTVSRTATLREVVDLFQKHAIHRVIVVENQKVQSVVSMSDVLRLFAENA